MTTATPTDSDLSNAQYSATYCPDDNKLRIYCGRVERPTYEWLRGLGYVATPKQSCAFVATWTPAREDAALAMIGDNDDISDESESPEERAADRAERFSGYLDNRRAEAGAMADTFDNGPTAFGHQSRERAARQAARHDRHRTGATSQWSKAEYWQARTAGVILHAIYKASPRVRRGRILTLEAEQRAYPKDSGRWGAHVYLRLTYERAMLENEGGSAGNVEMEIGGRIGSYLILQIHKSNVTKAVVSVTVSTPGANVWGRAVNRQKINIQKFGEDIYTAPTPDDLAEAKALIGARSDAMKASNATAPKLLNPTDEDAQKLQDAWNDATTAKRSFYGKGKPPAAVARMTQAAYSARSKGDYSPASSVFVGPDYVPTHQQYRGNVADGAAFKIRQISPGDYCGCNCVVIITDKPRHPIPACVAAEQPANA